MSEGQYLGRKIFWQVRGTGCVGGVSESIQHGQDARATGEQGCWQSARLRSEARSAAPAERMGDSRALQKKSAAGKGCRRPNGRSQSHSHVQKPVRAIWMSPGNGARSVVFGGGGSRLVLGAGAGAGAAGPGAAGAALGTEVPPQPPQLPQPLQFGQTHSTVQPRTQCSFVTGQTMSLWTS